MQHDATDELHVEVPHVERASAGLPDDGERFRNQLVDRRAVGQALTEFRRLRAELLVGEPLNASFLGVDLCHERPDAFQLAVVCRADDFREKGVDNHAGRNLRRRRAGRAAHYPARNVRNINRLYGSRPVRSNAEKVPAEPSRRGRPAYLGPSSRIGFVFLSLIQIS